MTCMYNVQEIKLHMILALELVKPLNKCVIGDQKHHCLESLIRGFRSMIYVHSKPLMLMASFEHYCNHFIKNK